MTGGGTGGHITPLITLAHELKQKEPNAQIIYIGELGSKFAAMTAADDLFDRKHRVFAGKFRRYHNRSWLAHLLDFKTNLLNLRDLFLFTLGLIQSYWLLLRLKPDVIFLKGGFVGVPVGLNAALLRIPFVTHDSDALPGLANRLVSRWALVHTTALPISNYPYPHSKTKQVGVVVSHDYQPIDAKLQTTYKTNLGLGGDEPLLLITGGSLGASRLNKAVVNVVKELLESYPKLEVIHQVGKGKLGDWQGYKHDRLKVLEFLTPMYEYTGAADVVVTRAGANTLAELGVQGKACIVVPNPDLTGGHQSVNAKLLEEAKAAIVIEETKLSTDLSANIKELLDNANKRDAIAKQLRDLTPNDAASKLAMLLLNIVKDHSQN